MKSLSFIRFNHNAAMSFYEILEVPKTSSVKDIKLQFKKLSKKYHPDLNSHLEEEEKKLNSDRFIRIVNAYETLKDKKKKEEYDRSLRNGSYGMSGTGGRFRDDYASSYSYNNARKEWENKYYGEARHSGSRSRLNRTRTRVNNPSGFSDENTTFNGKHVNYGDRFNVPHFNYEKHLLKHLKFEQRIINKQLTEEEREAILLQLTKNADISEISEELITKHMMRQVNKKDKSAKLRESVNFTPSNPFIYQKPNNENKHGQAYTYGQENETDYDDGSTFKAVAIISGATGMSVMLYKLIAG